MDRRGRTGRPFARLKAEIKAGATHCAVCGTPISEEFPWPDPRCVTVGHIVPLALGGDPLDPSNVRPECMACNSGDGTRIARVKRRGDLESYENGDW